jgi:hypothetical protein
MIWREVTIGRSNKKGAIRNTGGTEGDEGTEVRFLCCLNIRIVKTMKTKEYFVPPTVYVYPYRKTSFTEQR